MLFINWLRGPERAPLLTSYSLPILREAALSIKNMPECFADDSNPVERLSMVSPSENCVGNKMKAVNVTGILILIFPSITNHFTVASAQT